MVSLVLTKNRAKKIESVNAVISAMLKQTVVIFDVSEIFLFCVAIKHLSPNMLCYVFSTKIFIHLYLRKLYHFEAKEASSGISLYKSEKAMVMPTNTIATADESVIKRL